MKRKFLLMILLAGMAFMSCNEANDNLKRIHIFKVVSPIGSNQSGAIEISGKSQECPFTVLSTTSWAVDISESDGFSISTKTGISGNTPVIVYAAMNNSGATRTATVTFYFEGEPMYEYEITQAEVEPYIDVLPAFVPLKGDQSEFTVTISTNQTSWAYEIMDNGGDWITEKSKENLSVTFTAGKNETGKTRSADIKFYSELNPQAFAYVSVQQSLWADAPAADLFDASFGPNKAAQDVSPMGMTVNLRDNEYVSTTYLEKYGRYAAVFSRSGNPYSGQATGYYTVPYTPASTFGQALADGFSIEILVRRYDNAGTAQIKPFASTQAGGTGICFRANTNEFNFEAHTGGAWRNCYSGIVAQKDVYYHSVATWDKVNNVANLYVDGVLTSTTTTTGDFTFMTTNVSAYWFGIGADPNPNDLGEATFYGEVVIARIYDDPLSAEQVYTLWTLVKE